MRMSNQMREIMNDISATRTKLQVAVKDRNAEEAKIQKEKLDELNALFAAAEADFNAEQNAATDDPEGDKPKSTAPQYNSELFYKALRNRFSGGAVTLTDEERKTVAVARQEFSARYSEGTKEGGGYTVPDDLSTEIYEKITEDESVRTLVDVEPVRSLTGTRIAITSGEDKLYNTEEYEEIKEMNSREFYPVTYRQKKFAGISPLSSELLDDSFANFKLILQDWLASASRTTENAQVMYGIGGDKHCQGILSTKDAYIEITEPAAPLTVEFLRSVKYTLKSGYRKNAIWLTNTDGFLLISAIKEDNKSIIQPDPIHEEQYLLLGRPIKVMDFIATDEENKCPLIFGDFKRAYKMFVRKDFGIAVTDVAAGAFETDSIRMRGIERFDGRVMDNNALVIVRGLTVTPLSVTEPKADFGATGEVTEESLKYLTKAQLLELAKEYDETSVNNGNSKQEIVTALLAKINPGD